MGEIKYRKLDFRFDDDIPFHFNPRNLAVSQAVNSLSLMAPAFEGYFIKAFRDAMPRIRNERVRRDAEIFIEQEAQHSRHHVAHARMLIRKHRELADAQKGIVDSYKRLYDEQPLEFHLAYTATIELCFGPIAKFIVENRDTLFAGGDSRISSFVLWHFVEEFEHRNCAIDVFNDVVGSHVYRLRQVPATRRHLTQTSEIARRAFDRLAEAGLEPRGDDAPGKEVAWWRRKRLTWQLLCTLLPYHKPDHLRQPDWATRWLAEAETGRDMTMAYVDPIARRAGSERLSA